MTRQQQILELATTVKCKLEPSPLHGIGVFAIRDIHKGERLYCYPAPDNRAKYYTLTFAALKELPEEVRDLIIQRWPCVANDEYFLSPNFDQRLISYMNHSDTPNYDELTDQALRDIKRGEEITEDYRHIPNFEQVRDIIFSFIKN